MDDFYREHILDHYKHPRNYGKLQYHNAYCADNLVSCGDSLSMQLFIENQKVKAIKFGGIGCAISMASASLLTEFAKGKPISQLQTLQTDDMLSLLGISLTPTRLKCALLSLEILQKALFGYQVKFN